MADFRASRPIEDFFVNPAFYFKTQQQQSNMVDDNTLYSGAADQYNDNWFTTTKTVASNGKAPATMTDLVDRPMLLRGYTSDEEASSPIDDDSSSVYSEYSDISEFTFPEALAESCNKVEQQCNQAQAIKIQSAGKAKVVSLPKLVDIPSRRGVVRPASIGYQRKSTSRRNSAEQTRSARSSQESHHGSDSSSVMNSPASTAPSSVIIEQSIEVNKRRSSVASRHVPLLEAARAISPTSLYPTSIPNTPIEPRSIGLIKRENTVSSQRSNSTTSSLKHPMKRMNKLSSNFSLNRIGKEFRDTFVPQDVHATARGSYLEEPEAVTVTQQAPPRNSSVSKPKMVARAANERAPTIELPPFPGDEDGFSNDWPLKFGTTSTLPKRVAAGA